MRSTAAVLSAAVLSGVGCAGRDGGGVGGAVGDDVGGSVGTRDGDGVGVLVPAIGAGEGHNGGVGAVTPDPD